MTQVTDADHLAWLACWNPVVNPTPDIPVAVPTGCSAAAKTMAYGDPFVATAGLYRVQWLGWQPGVGLVCAQGSWRARMPAPDCPRHDWQPWKSGQRLRPVYGMHVQDMLPFPASGNPAMTTRTHAGQLQGRSMAAFLRALPEGMLACMQHVASSAGGPLGRYVDGVARFDMRAMCWYMQCLLGADMEVGPQGRAMSAQQTRGSSLGVQARGLRRRQFVQTYPVFSQLLWHNLLDAVDEGRSAVDAISQQTGASAALVRNMAHVPQDSVRAAQECLHGVNPYSMLNGMAPSWLACLAGSSPHVWRAIAAIAEVLDQGPVTSETLSSDSSGTPEIARAMGAGMQPVGGSMEWLADTGALWAHFDDMACEMALELALPAVTWRSLDTPRRDEMVRFPLTPVKTALLSTGVRKLARTLNAHLEHAVRDADQAVNRTRDGQDGWGRAMPDVEAPGGMVLRFLADQDELSREGQAMEHCVGGYGSRCREATSLVMSLGRWSTATPTVWQPSSTVDLRAPVRGSAQVPGERMVGKDYWIAQHLGYRNARPSQEDCRALAWWQGQVESGVLALPDGCLRPDLPHTEGCYQSRYSPLELRTLLGHDWNTSAAHMARWARWRVLLDTRAASFGDWLLALPKGYLESGPGATALAERAVDMDSAFTSNQTTPGGAG